MSDPGEYDADIIILSLDRELETLAAIESARRQTGISKHIWVLDQGSRPDTLWRLQQATASYADVVLICSERNLGVAGGRNRLSALGAGRVIVALDNDAEFDRHDTVARMVAALDADPGLAAVGCRIVRYADGRDDLTSWGYPATLLSRAAETFDAVTFVGAGHAIRREAWRQAGGYDDTLFFCWEEYDFCLRAIALGWRVRYRGDIEVRHKVSPERRVGWKGKRWFYFVRNRLYIERKLDRPWLALLPRVIGYLLKGVLNGATWQTVVAIRAAVALSPAHRRRLDRAALNYLTSNDMAHRGGAFTRLRREILSRNVASATGR